MSLRNSVPDFHCAGVRCAQDSVAISSVISVFSVAQPFVISVGDAELARVVSSTPVTEDLLRTVQEGHRRWIGDGTPVGDDISIVVIEHVADHAMAGG